MKTFTMRVFFKIFQNKDFKKIEKNKHLLVKAYIAKRSVKNNDKEKYK